MAGVLDREDSMVRQQQHKRLQRLLPRPGSSSSLHQLNNAGGSIYPTLQSEYALMSTPPASAPPIYAPTTYTESSSSGSGRSSSPSPSSLEKYSSVLISELKKRPQKEKALQDALEIQSKIGQIEAQVSAAEAEAVRKRQQLQEQLEELERKKEETRKNLDMVQVDLDRTKEELHSSIKNLQAHSDYRDKTTIDRMNKELEQLNFHADKVQTVARISSSVFSKSGDNGGSGYQNDEHSVICPICLSVPNDQVFTCLSCDQPLCGSCRPQVTSCPICRKNFKNHPPRRNRLAEKLIACKRSL